jgi:hypothetical protein
VQGELHRFEFLPHRRTLPDGRKVGCIMFATNCTVNKWLAHLWMLYCRHLYQFSGLYISKEQCSWVNWERRMLVPQSFTDSQLLSLVFMKYLIILHALYVAREGSFDRLPLRVQTVSSVLYVSSDDECLLPKHVVCSYKQRIRNYFS